MKIFNLRTYSILLLAIPFLIACGDSNNQEAENTLPATYTIQGKIDSLSESSEIVLNIFDPVTQAKTPIDTTSVAEDGTYKLTYEFSEPDLFRVDFIDEQTVMLAIDEGQSEIQLDVEGRNKGRVTITGSEDSEKLQGYELFRRESFERVVRPTYNAMRAATKEGDTQGEVEAVEAYSKASTEHRKELIDYTSEKIGTSVALFGTMLRWTGDDEIDRLESLVNNFKAQRPDLKMTKVMDNKIQRYKKVAIGAIAPAISMNDTSGTQLNLKDLTGKYTLLDFWASWCGPCLLQVPDLKEAYADYHEKGFEIIGVSVDTRGKRWKDAINKYEMDWPHMSDLKGWKSEAAADYNVTFIPFNMLIDEKGTILAKNLHSKELQGKLAELFVEQ